METIVSLGVTSRSRKILKKKFEQSKSWVSCGAKARVVLQLFVLVGCPNLPILIQSAKTKRSYLIFHKPWNIEQDRYDKYEQIYTEGTLHTY